jgi:hypothetical protein
MSTTSSDTAPYPTHFRKASGAYVYKIERSVGGIRRFISTTYTGRYKMMQSLKRNATSFNSSLFYDATSSLWSLCVPTAPTNVDLTKVTIYQIANDGRLYPPEYYFPSEVGPIRGFFSDEDTLSGLQAGEGSASTNVDTGTIYTTLTDTLTKQGISAILGSIHASSFTILFQSVWSVDSYMTTSLSSSDSPTTVDIDQGASLSYFGFTLSSEISGGSFLANTNYKYKISYEYDGFQESPLNNVEWTINTSGTNGRSSISFNANLEEVLLPPRLSGINIYRLDGALYRYIDNIKYPEDFNAHETLDGVLTGKIVDTFHAGASYEARTGCPQTIKNNFIHYELSEELNGELIAANCFIPETSEDASNYIFKSKPGNFSQFNWVDDNLLLPDKPTAIKGFKGRLFVFTANKIYRVNTQGMYIEDIHDGIGCLNKHCVLSTEYGMFFVDANGAYMHNGSNITKLSGAIETFSYASWSVGLIKFLKQSVSISDSNPKLPVKVSYEPNRGSFLIWGHDVQTWTGSNVYFGVVWAYNLERQRWDYWDAPEHQGLLAKENGDTYIFTKAHKVKNYLKGSTSRKWEWFSKDLTLGVDTQEKIFSRIKVAGNMVQTYDTSSAADSISVLANRAEFGSPYTTLEKRKDYLKLKNVSVNYDKTLCVADGGTYPNATTVSIFLGSHTVGGPGDLINGNGLVVSNFPRKIDFWNFSVPSIGEDLDLPTSNDAVEGTTSPTFYLLDSNGEYAWFHVTTKTGDAAAFNLAAGALTSLEGTSPYIDIVQEEGNPWYNLTDLPHLASPVAGNTLSGNYIYTSLPTCTFTTTTQNDQNEDVTTTTYSTKKNISVKKMKTLQIQLRAQTHPVDSLGIIYRRKSVK